MRQQLIQYVNLLFAGVENCQDIRQEILQNTLDRYDDLIASGKVPEAAYRLAITGIGDINEILGASAPVNEREPEGDTERKKRMQAMAIGLYILCPAPVMILGKMGGDWLSIGGVCVLLAMVAATMLLMLSGKGPKAPQDGAALSEPEAELRKSISALVWILGTAAYFTVSLLCGGWQITWLIFPLTAAVQGIIKAVLDLKRDRTNALLRMAIWGLTAAVLAAIPICVLSLGNREPGSAVSMALPALTLPAEEIDSLEIEWACGEIIIQSADVGEITISETKGSEQTETMVCQVRENTLKIQFCQQSLYSGISIGSSDAKDLRVYVPEDWLCDSLEVDSADADLRLQNMSIQRFDLDGANGVCDFTDCRIGSMDIDTAAGDVTFSGQLESLDFDAASASFTGIFSNTPSRIDMDGMSGTLDITLPEDCGYSVSLEGLSSSFRSGFSGGYTHGDGRCRIDVDGLDCDVSIRAAAAACQ